MRNGSRRIPEMLGFHTSEWPRREVTQEAVTWFQLLILTGFMTLSRGCSADVTPVVNQAVKMFEERWQSRSQRR